MRLRTKFVLAAAGLLSGCATSGPEIRVVDLGCDWGRPILVSREDVLTEETAVQILAHNLILAERCPRYNSRRPPTRETPL